MASRGLEWIHLPHMQQKMLASYPFMRSLLIAKGRMRSREFFEKEMHNIIIPYNKKQFKTLLMEDENWGISLKGYNGQIKYHYPRHPLIEFFKETEVIFPTKCSRQPLESVLCIFTDGSSNGKSVIYIHIEDIHL